MSPDTDAAAMRARAASVSLSEVGPDDPQVREATSRYFAELDRRFPGGFDPGEPDHEGRFLVASAGDELVAAGGVRPHDQTTGEIKRMWVAESWRGAGLGSRMLRELEALAVRLGYERVVLDTNRTLVEAIAMYERSGYAAIERYNDNPYAQAWFAKSLT